MKRERRRHPVRNFILILFLLMLGAAAAVSTYFGVKGYRLYQNAISQTTIEERVESIRAETDFVEYSQMPKFYIDAVISVEDHRFMYHPGIDPIAILRAALTDIRERAFIEGGSTITQQLAKNLLFTQDKKIERKAAEVFAAFDLEKKYGKEEIFELYVNMNCFGSGYDGFFDAAIGYFGKFPAELTKYESAMLAGIPNAPSAYSPYVNLELANQRVAQVLQSMVNHRIITQDEAEQILAGAWKGEVS